MGYGSIFEYSDNLGFTSACFFKGYQVEPFCQFAGQQPDVVLPYFQRILTCEHYLTCRRHDIDHQNILLCGVLVQAKIICEWIGCNADQLVTAGGSYQVDNLGMASLVVVICHGQPEEAC